MLKRLQSSDAGFAAQLASALSARHAAESLVAPVVAEILTAVQRDGDRGLLSYTEQFDRVAYTAETLRVSAEAVDAAERACAPEVVAALRVAAERIEAFHAKQLPAGLDYVDDAGVRLGMRWSAISDVGLYVPGGQASYPSSVLMNAIPAKVAGCARLVMAVPTPDGVLNPAVLVAARLAGVDEIYQMGGAQAVAALAYGTDSIAPVHKIVGPGNAYVAEAKRQVFGTVGIDMIAGPSEILVVADASTPPEWIAADLLSQAEHDAQAQSILITNDAAYADAVDAALEATLAELPRRAIAEASIRDHGLCLVVSDWDETVTLINQIAPEHLELAIDQPEALLDGIHHAGAIFLGRYTPEAVGDYIAGPSHVLPTSQTARFSSGLSVYDFVKKSSIIGCSVEAFQSLAAVTEALAEAEGLGAHARSVSVRMG